ncbi:glycosyltransferase [Bombella pollinis]|uniref:Glycosyltransferase n=1 Tax=Bombella pollinis TaxID=2967337 RepID=A0ABT3WMM7_9PROT|nr:glycosyltransferase [Bombella pollinis]MCX5620420.1 glycosyltransferase [Bombella pollinis]
MKTPVTFIPGYGRFCTPQEEARWEAQHLQELHKMFTKGMACIKQGELEDGLFWLGRAERLSGRAATLSFTYAMALWEGGFLAKALPRLEDLWGQSGVRETGLALAGVLSQQGRAVDAARVMAQLLARNSLGDGHDVLMDGIVASIKAVGWASLSCAGVLWLRVRKLVTVFLDDVPLGPFSSGMYDLAEHVPQQKGPWWRGERLHIICDGHTMLGGQIDLQAVIRCHSLITPEAQGVRGWLWYPGEPGAVPTIRVDGHEVPIKIEGLAEGFSSTALLQRPYGFYLPYEAWPDLAVKRTGFYDGYGRLLQGAPLDPALVQLMQSPSSTGNKRKGWTREGCRKARKYVGKGQQSTVAAGCAVIIPVYRDKAMVQACVESVLATIPPSCRVIIIDDASPEVALRTYLLSLAQEGRVRIKRHERNQGFVESINTGLALVPEGWDVIWLNSDTLVFGPWVERLRRWLGQAGVGTVTPLSNAGGLTSYPVPNRDNPAPSVQEAAALDALCQQQAEAMPLHVSLPTANGFCMAVSAACLKAVGRLRGAYFAQGYGEENDFCLRASEAGFTHLVGADVYVLHYGHGSFGAEGSPLLQRNLTILNRLYPGYDAAIQRWKQVEPLRVFWRQLDWQRMAQHRVRFSSAVVLLQHRGGGGVARAVREHAVRLCKAGLLPFIIEPTMEGCRVVSPVEGLVVPNLRFALPEDYPILVAFLQEMGVECVIWHHLLGHEPGMRQLHHKLGVPYEVYVHDHIWFCPRIALCNEEGRYCGEPSLTGCEACLAEGNVPLDEAISLPALIARSTKELNAARRIVAPSEDAAKRLARHVSLTRSIICEALEDDQTIHARSALLVKDYFLVRGRPRRIVILGGISRWKGYDVILTLGQYIQKHALPLHLILIGGTHDDDALLQAGVSVTGAYEEADTMALLRDADADIGFIASIAPETWCYALGWLWQAGLAVVGFDIGASAARIKQAGPQWGQIIPLGMPVERLAAFFMTHG